MNTFNRVLIVLFLLLMIGTLTAVFVAPHIVLTGMGQRMVDWGNYLGRPDIVDQWLRLFSGILIAFTVNIFLLIFIFFEIRPRRKRYINVQLVTGGNATVSLTSVEEQIQYKLDSLPGIIRVTSKARAKGKSVFVETDVAIGREAQVTQTAEKLVDTIQNVVTGDMGLQLAGKPEVRIVIVNAPTVTPSANKRRPAPKRRPLAQEDIHTTQTLPSMPIIPEQPVTEE